MDINSAKKSFFDLLAPKQAFILGCVFTILILSTIGCLILGSYVWKGQNSKTFNINAAANTANNTANATKTTNSSSPSTVAVSGTLAPISDSDHISGSGDIALVVYSDFQCPFCKNFDASIRQVIEDYAGKVKVVFRNFPLSFHENAQDAAEAAECAAEQGKFWEYAAKLFDNQSSLGEETYKLIVTELGLNAEAFASCRSSDKILTAIQEDQTSASAVGVRGTPSSFIIDKDGTARQIKGGAVSYSSLKILLDQELAK